MSGRRFRNLILIAIVAGVGYWIYKDRPTAGGLIDSLTGPLFGSKAAVDSSERNRVVADASTSITDQTEQVIAALKEGMRSSEVRDVLGNPDHIEREKGDGDPMRWTYAKIRRELLFRNDRVVSIVVK
jgi:hypothetical protein